MRSEFEMWKQSNLKYAPTNILVLYNGQFGEKKNKTNTKIKIDVVLVFQTFLEFKNKHDTYSKMIIDS